MVKGLPEVAQKRVKALKNLQLDFLKHECEFFTEVYQLERKYQEKYQTIADKRKKIIGGDYEPNDTESQFKSDDEEEDDEDSAEMAERLKTMASKALPQFDANVKGESSFAMCLPLFFSLNSNKLLPVCMCDPFRNSRILVNNFPQQ